METSDTRALLRWGVFVGPVYLVVGLAQALTRDGFDLGRHPLSVLANGPGGWVQTGNFVAGGLMVLAAAVGLRRVLASRAVGLFLGLFGASMLAAAVFRADPVDGFPPGTPLGFPTTISSTGLMHFASGALGFTVLAVSCFCAVRPLSRQGQRGLARWSLASGLLIVLGFYGGFLLPIGVLGIWITVVVGWAWLAVVSHRLRSQA